MAYQTKASLDTEVTYVLGGTNEKTGKPNPTSVEGYFLGNKTTPDKGYGPGTLHIFQTETGNVGVWGKTSSKNLLTPEHIGQMCLLEFTGMSTPAKKGRQPAYKYKLQFDKGNTIDVSELDVNASNESEPDYGDGYERDVSDDTESYVSEAAAPRATAPKVAARTPSAESQAKVRALLAGKSKTA